MLIGLTPDGAQLLGMQAGSNGLDIVAVDVEEPRQARILLATKADERSPSVSPDGRWVAYDSDDEGQTEVFVGPFPDHGAAALEDLVGRRRASAVVSARATRSSFAVRAAA